MSTPLHVQSYFDSQLAPLFSVVDEVLNEWTSDKCYQLPMLMMNIKAKMKWEGEEGEKQFRAKDPIIRDYIRNHPTWYITRGAHGGVMRRAEKEKKEAAAEAKRTAIAEAKREISAALDAEIAKKTAGSTSVITTDEDNTDIVSE
jgi:hypothetical protein